MTEIFNEPFTQSNGTAWSTTRWTLNRAGTTTVDVQSNRGRTVITNSSGNTVLNTMKHSAVAEPELYFEINRLNLGSGTYGCSFQHSGTLNTANGVVQNGYRFNLGSGGTTFTVIKYTNSVSSNLGTVTLPATGNNDIAFRFRYTGGTLYIRTWSLSVAEPSTWGLTSVTPALPAGVNSIWHIPTGSTFSSSTVTWDNITVYEAGHFVGWGMPL